MKTSHSVILTDIKNGRILVADLDKQDPLAPQNVIWEWVPAPEQGWKTTQESLKEALSEVKVRYCAYHKSTVVLFCSSRGNVGMVAYPEGKCLWEAMVGVSPHAVELLPNGDLVVGASGGGVGEKGAVYYLHLQEDGTYQTTDVHPLYGAHGLVWDPKLQYLWASGTDDVVAFTLKENGLTPVEGAGTVIPCSYGHDLMQDLSDPNVLWVSPSPVVYQFRKDENKLFTEFPHSDVIHPLLRAKGITSFPDGTVAWVAYGHHTSSEHPDHFSALWQGKEIITYTDEAAGFNKVRAFLEQYQ